MTVEVKCDSFFNIFETIDPESEEKTIKEKKGDDDEDDMDDDMTDKLQDELELADQFKDDLVPLALEYYLGVIDIDDQEGDDDSDGGGDSDDDKKPAKKKKGKKGGAPEMPLGPDGKP